MGRLAQEKTERLQGKKVIWFHAASVGEVKVLSTIVPQFRKDHPDYVLVVSTVTKTGKKEAARILKGIGFVFFVPVDLKRFVRRALRRIRPVALILVETELWPNLIREAKRSGSFVGMVNGRISKRSLRRYRLVRNLFKTTLSHIDLLCLQSGEYRRRMRLLGADPDRIEVTGNLKFDRLLLASQGKDTDQLKASLHIPDHRRVVIGGSTREGEEEILIRVFEKLSWRFDDLLFVLAPRHLDRLNQVEKMFSDSQMDFVRRSQLDAFVSKNTSAAKGSLEDTGLILLDTMGELSAIYSVAHAAFVGGTLVPVGGHNLLEPAIYGVPVLFGPYVDNFKEEAKLLLASGGGIKVKDQDELYFSLSGLLSDEDRRQKLGEKARQAVRSKTGVAQRTADLIFSILEKR